MSGYAHSGLEAYSSGIEATLADLRRRDAVAKIWAAGDIVAGLRRVVPAVGV